MRNSARPVAVLSWIALSWVALTIGCQPPPAGETTEPLDATDQSASSGDRGTAPDSRSAARDTNPPQRSASTEAPAPRVAEESEGASQPRVAGQRANLRPDGTREKAAAGVGKKGQGYGGAFISEPARQYFQIRERVVFQAQIPQALNTYKALDPQGKGPPSHQEFMDKVIQQNGITLPDLPAGYEYQYDPQAEELMVGRPSR